MKIAAPKEIFDGDDIVQRGAAEGTTGNLFNRAKVTLSEPGQDGTTSGSADFTLLFNKCQLENITVTKNDDGTSSNHRFDKDCIKKECENKSIKNSSLLFRTSFSSYL